VIDMSFLLLMGLPILLAAYFAAKAETKALRYAKSLCDIRFKHYKKYIL